MEPLFGDHLEGAVRWNEGGDLRALVDTSVRLRLRDTDLFGLHFN